MSNFYKAMNIATSLLIDINCRKITFDYPQDMIDELVTRISPLDLSIMDTDKVIIFFDKNCEVNLIDV